MGLKEKALAGEKLDDVLIIDADAHYMVEYLPNFDDYIQRMDRVGIDKLFCSTMGNLDFQKSYPDRILSMYRYRDLSPDHELQKKDLMKWLDNPGTIGFGEVCRALMGIAQGGICFAPNGCKCIGYKNKR